jgi:hypothetical protein
MLMHFHLASRHSTPLQQDLSKPENIAVFDQQQVDFLLRLQGEMLAQGESLRNRNEKE